MNKRLLILADTTTSGLKDALQKILGSSIDIHIGPYDNIIPIILDEEQKYLKSINPDTIIIISRPERIFSQWDDLIIHQKWDKTHEKRDRDRFICGLKRISKLYNHIIVSTWAQRPGKRNLNPWSQHGVIAILAQQNLELASNLNDISNIWLIDRSSWYNTSGIPGVDPRLWYISHSDPINEAATHAAIDIAGIYCSQQGLSCKLLIVDLDNTLWGGEVGDDGFDGIELGPSTFRGEVYQDIQKRICALQSTGILIAISSKNTHRIAWDVIENHPDMILRPEFIADHEINWESKSKNIYKIMKRMNVLPQFVYFLDDSPHEQEEIRQIHPYINVLSPPKDPTLWPKFLDFVPNFEKGQVTEDDKGRTKMLKEESSRREEEKVLPSRKEWIASLELKINGVPIDEKNLTRCVQLINRSNQFNLNGKKTTEKETGVWLEQENHYGRAYHASDRFGSYGTCAVILFRSHEQSLIITTFVMSCRIMGRDAEMHLLRNIEENTKNLGTDKIILSFQKTERNKPMQDFIENLHDSVQKYLVKIEIASND